MSSEPGGVIKRRKWRRLAPSVHSGDRVANGTTDQPNTGNNFINISPSDFPTTVTNHAWPTSQSYSNSVELTEK